jgi:predicted  nucleic acid-binding Zn-ribbon protein
MSSHKKEHAKINKDTSHENLAEMIDALARTTAKGFDLVEDKLDRLHEDITILRKDVETGFYELKPLKKEIGSHTNEITDLQVRVSALERKSGNR